MAQQSYKKFVASAATATLVASALIPVASAANVNTAAFTDVGKDYKEAVEFLVSNNISKGYSETQYGINMQIKRGDAAIMIANAAGLNDEKAPAAGFSDVPTRAALAVNSLKAAGVVNGKSTTRFGFEDNLTRGEAAIMLQRAFDLKAGDTKNTFTDVKADYDAAVDALVANKVTKGINDTQFGTANNIKRGDFAKFLYALKDQIIVPYAVETVTVVNETTTTAKLKVANKDLTAADFKVLVNGEAVTPEKVESDAKGEVYTITHATLKGKKGVLSVNSKQADFDFVSGVQVESVKATNAKALTVTFTQAFEGAAADFTVNKGTVKTNIASVTMSADKKTATIELTSKLTEGEYTVKVAQKDKDALTGSVTVQNEKVSAVEILTDVAPVTTNEDGSLKGATAAYMVTNQYGEDVTKLYGTSLVKSVSGAATAADIKADGSIVFTTLATNAKLGDKINLTLVDSATGVSTTKQLTLSNKSAAASTTVGELYNKDGKELDQDTDTTKDKFYLPIQVKDQYGKEVTSVDRANAELIVTNTNPAIVQFAGATGSKIQEVTINGKKVLALEVSEVGLAGTANVLLISNTTGANTQTSVKVNEGVKISSLALSAPSELVTANKDVMFPLTVMDSKGNEVKTKTALDKIKDKVKTSVGSEIVEVKDKGLFVKVLKGNVEENRAVTVVVTSDTGKVATQTVVAKAEAKPTVITGISDKKATALRSGDTTGVTIANTDLVVEDQYGQVITDKATLSAIEFTATAETAGVVVIEDTANKSSKITPAAEPTQKSTKVNFKLKNATNVEASTLTKTFTIVDVTDFTSYSVEDVDTIYAVTNPDTGVSTVSSAYNQPIVVKAKTDAGETVTLTEGADFTVTGKPGNGEEVKFAKDATTAKVTVTVTISRTGEQFTKELTYSNVAPKVQDFIFTSTETTSGTVDSAKAIEQPITAVGTFTKANVLSTNAKIVTTDQYGLNKLAEDVETLTIVPEKASEVTLSNNGKANASAALNGVDSAKLVAKVKIDGVTKNINVVLRKAN
ncbi:S-layer homology domain-containing protein [Sporosarcina sp. ZBG7A]|uniref:S-layer homology domain-containing protein n=1 Tax=Sporosarcina sp. ZBG7A TaxID=1582223 RepID=UPI000691D2F6|nr:S-layer homology domain-containing protein [Sporosarcina sp. ZBG7A]